MLSAELYALLGIAYADSSEYEGQAGATGPSLRTSPTEAGTTKVADVVVLVHQADYYMTAKEVVRIAPAVPLAAELGLEMRCGLAGNTTPARARARRR